MKKKIIISLLLFTIGFYVVADDNDSEGVFSVAVDPYGLLPLGDSQNYYTTGFGTELSFRYSIPNLNFLFGRLGIDYNYLPILTKDGVTSLSAMAGPGLQFSPVENLNLSVYSLAGWYFGFISGDNGGNGSYLSVKAGADVQYSLSKALSLRLGAHYSYKPYLATGVGISVGGVINPAKFSKPKTYEPYGNSIDLLESRSPGISGSGLDVERVGFNQVFPVLYSYYDDNPVGKVSLYNNEKNDITDVSLSFYVDRYMDEPKASPPIDRIAGGSTASFDIFSLFSDNVLDITEGTKVAANIIIKYKIGSEETTRKYTASIEMYDRNAMTWDDDRKAAAFVTAKEPSVLEFAKNISSLVKQEGQTAVDKNLRIAMCMHEGLRKYGLTYQVDPKTPFAEYSQNRLSVDFLQFPRQTLQYSAGDCDDLSILYSALLESVGIDTAFITVPGHIYIAFALDMKPSEVSRTFLNPDDVIIHNDTAWLPVEVTMMNDDFLAAWNEGAVEWHRYSTQGNANIHPMHEAWREYKPVGLPGTAQIAFPSRQDILDSYSAELKTFTNRELMPRIQSLEERIAASGGDPRFINRLGVLYARYGKTEHAEEAFSRALERGDYVPALMNLGNLNFLADSCEEALRYYKRAETLEPDNAKIIAAVTRTNYELGNYSEVNRLYGILNEKEPGLAREFAYLGSSATENRASAADTYTEYVLWIED